MVIVLTLTLNRNKFFVVSTNKLSLAFLTFFLVIGGEDVLRIPERDPGIGQGIVDRGELPEAPRSK